MLALYGMAASRDKDTRMDLGLQDKVAIVTAASRGLGRAVALAFAAEGAPVVVNARNAERLAGVARFTEREQAELVSWSTPPTWSSTSTARASGQGKNARPPGQGKFLIKVGGRPGIPFELVLTAAEERLSNTNKRWAVR